MFWYTTQEQFHLRYRTGIFILPEISLNHPGRGQLVSLLVPADNTNFHLTHNKVTSLYSLDFKKPFPKLHLYIYYQIKSALLKKFLLPFWGISKLYQHGYETLLWLSCTLGRGTFTSLFIIGYDNLLNLHDANQPTLIPKEYWNEGRMSNDSRKSEMLLFEQGLSTPLLGHGLFFHLAKL